MQARPNRKVANMPSRVRTDGVPIVRIIDEMEQKHIIGPFEGSKPRKVLMSATDWLERKANRGE